jgi:hypothetical protein
MATNRETEVEQPTLSADKWEQRFYPNAQLTHIEIELFAQDLNEMREYLKQGTFENETEGWRYLLQTGYAYLRGKERLLPPDGSGIDPAGVAENLRRQVEIESMYAVLKRRAYVWMTDYQTMNLQTGALHTLLSGHKALIDQLQEENKALKTEMVQLQTRLSQLAPEEEAPAAAPAPPEPLAPIPWWKRYLKRAG